MTNDIGHSVGRASRIVLPLLNASSTPAVPTGSPACPGLRGQACRTYTPARVPTAVVAAKSGSQIVVTWTAPPGAATPTTYRVTDVDRGTSSSVAGTIRTLSVPGALVGQTYQYRVTAVYSGVDAPASDASIGLLFS